MHTSPAPVGQGLDVFSQQPTPPHAAPKQHSSSLPYTAAAAHTFEAESHSFDTAAKTPLQLKCSCHDPRRCEAASI